MTHLLAVIALFAPVTPDAACEATWAKAQKPAAAETERCLRHFLGYAYGAGWDAEALTLDPGYGHPIEKKYQKADLARMAGHVRAVCPDASNADLPCARAIEFFEGMAGRKTSLFEDVNLGSFEPLLVKVLAGQPLDPDELFVGHPDLKWSAQTLRTLRNAAYARHGYLFKDADLNAFFYDARPEPAAGLPLKRGTSKDVKLSPVDGENVRLLKSLEK